MKDEQEHIRQKKHVDDEQSCSTNMCGPRIGGISLFQLIVIVIFVLMAYASARGQAIQENPDFKQKIDVIEHLGDKIDLTLPVIDASGDTLPLSSQFDDDLPVVLVFHYNDCPMLCSLVLTGVSQVTRDSDLVPGEDYRIVTVSVDPRETPQRTEASEQRYNGELPESATGQPWRFFTATQGAIDTLTEQVGFKYYYDEEREEYMHPAVIMTVSPDGKVSRYLYGVEFKPRAFRLAVVEASQGKVGNTVDRVLLYCMHYDPDAEGYVVLAGNVMKLGGAVTLVLLGLLLGGLWIKERVRTSKA